MKYIIKKIINKREIEDIYEKFIRFSPQRNIFCSKEILNFFFDDLDIYLVLKSNQIKSFVYLFRDKIGSITSEPFIYSGIINHSKALMKNARYNNEVFKINELIVNEIFSNYKDISINLPVKFRDTRPFLWFNYGNKGKKIFNVLPRYTSIINLKSKNIETIYNEIDDVKRRDIKKALNDNNYKVSDQINLNLMKSFYKETMKKNNGTFNNISLDKIFYFMENQTKKNKILQATTYYQEKPLYSVLFLHDDINSCYLYGAGDVEIKNRYAGSLALWSGIKQSFEKKILSIDLEGINSPYRGEYKLYFGGNIECYFRIISP